MNCERVFKLRAKAEQYNVKNNRHSFAGQDLSFARFRMSEKSGLLVSVSAKSIGQLMVDA